MKKHPELLRQWFDEDALAWAIGICIEQVQRVRREMLDRETWRIEHGYVAYTKEGAQALLDALGIELPVKKKGAPPDLWGRPALEDVLNRAEIGGTVTEHAGCERFTAMGPMQDPKKLLACRMSDGFGCTVLVPNNANFLMGMEFIGRPVNVAAAVYELVGAPPRWRGRW
jgi:hypothetical protein